MDEIKLLFKSLFMKRFFASMLKKKLAKYFGVDVSVVFDNIEITNTEDGNVRLRVQGEAVMPRSELMKLMDGLEKRA